MALDEIVKNYVIERFSNRSINSQLINKNSLETIFLVRRAISPLFFVVAIFNSLIGFPMIILMLLPILDFSIPNLIISICSIIIYFILLLYNLNLILSFKIKSPSNETLAIVKTSFSLFHIKSVLFSKNWFFKDKNSNSDLTLHFEDKFNGFLSKNLTTYNINAEIDKKNKDFFQGIIQIFLIDELGKPLITLLPLLDTQKKKRFRLLSAKDFEIVASANVDDSLIAFFSLVILYKFFLSRN